MQSLKEREEQDKKYNPAEQRQGGHDDLGVHPERREAEVDDLEKLYNAESAPEKKSKSPVDEKEQDGLDQANQKSASEISDNTDESGDWDNKTASGKKSKYKITRKQAVSAGLGAGFTIGIGIGFFTFMAGPLQFLQFAKLLERFHFDDSNRFSNSRTAKLFRYARKYTTGRPTNAQDFNMSRTGNKIAVHYEKKLAKQGIDMKFDDSGRLTSMHVNPDTPAGKKVIAGLEAEHGVPLRPDVDGKVHLDFAPNSSEITTAKGRRKMVSGAVNAMDMNGVSSSMAKRMLKIRARVNFHPLKNLGDAIDEKAKLKWKEYKEDVKKERAKRIDEGTEPPKPVKGTDADDAENPASEQEKSTKTQVDDTVTDITNSASDPEASFKQRTSAVRGKLTQGMGVAGIIMTFCGLDLLGDSVSDIQEQNIVQPLIRSGMDIVNVGSQIQSGQDINMAMLGAIADNFYDPGDPGDPGKPETKREPSSWMSGESIQSELGKPGTGVKMSDAAKPGKDRPAFFAVIDRITGLPGVDVICSATNSTIGGIFATIGTIALSATGVGAALTAIVTESIQQIIAGAFVDDLVRFLAGPALTVAGAKGGELGNYANFGAFLANNNTAKGMGGRALTKGERVALIDERNEAIRQNNKQKKFYARMLDVTSPDSLISKSVIQNNSIKNTQTGFASLIKSPFQLFNGFGSSIASLNPKAKAQTEPYDYGVDAFGFSIDERDSQELDDPYANAEKFEANSGQLLKEMNDKYGTTCFGTTIDPTTSKIKYEKAPKYDELEKNKAICGSENTDPNFLQYRMYIADTITAATITCYESIDETACQDLGLTSSNVTNPNTPSSGESPIIEKYQPALATSGEKINPKGVTLHWWAGDGGIDVLASTLRQRKLGVQFGVTNEGKIYQLTPNEDDKVNHASGANTTTFGIEIEGTDVDFGSNGPTANPAKFNAVVQLVKYLSKKYNITTESIGPESIVCGDVVGIHPHKAFNKCGNTKADIDDAYFDAVMNEVRE